MRRTLSISVGAVLVLLMILLMIGRASTNQSLVVAPTIALFPEKADQSFITAHANNADLNSGITMERSIPLYSSQANNVTFAVFNHTDEPIVFANQGFGLTVFAYDAINSVWETLQLQYAPYPESRILPPKLEVWDAEIGNSWDILENETTALGVKQLRLSVTGKGQTTNKIYSAYLDVSISP